LQHLIARVWARVCIFCSGSRLEVIGLENIPAETAVFAANHTSYMDTPVVFASLPFQFRILAKKELWGLPFIGWYLNHSGQIPIDTENPRTTLSIFGNGARTLRSGLSVFVFPEGGRTPDGQLQPFLNGAAFLAVRAQVPLVPIALIGVYDLLPMHTAHFYPGRTPLKLVVGQPIQTAGHTVRESEALTSQLRESIADLIRHHS
jgi:1-acyl-sn-glycerol-3-phosphate acyltransferase